MSEEEIKGSSAQDQRMVKKYGSGFLFLAALGLVVGLCYCSDTSPVLAFGCLVGAVIAVIYAIKILVKPIRCPKCKEGKMSSSSKLAEQGAVYYKQQPGGQKQIPYRKDTYKVTMTCQKCGYTEVFTEEKEACLLFSQGAK